MPGPQRPEGDAHPVGGLGVLDARLHTYHTTSYTRCLPLMPLSCLQPALRNFTPASEPPTVRTTSDARICPPGALAALACPAARNRGCRHRILEELSLSIPMV